MPLVLDDVVSVADEKQLSGLLEVIKGVGTDQTILLTSDKALLKKLDDMHITCNVVTL